MKKTVLVLGFSLSTVVFADEFATTDSGTRVLLKENGTWEVTAGSPIIKGDSYQAVLITKGFFDMGCYGIFKTVLILTTIEGTVILDGN